MSIIPYIPTSDPSLLTPPPPSPFLSGTLDEDLTDFAKDASLLAALSNDTSDLKSYTTASTSDLAVSEHKCVTDYLGKTTEINSLQDTLQDADGILRSLQEMLLGFKADLGGISGDIKHLQTSSLSMSRKLTNRASVAVMLTEYLRNTVVSPAVADYVMRGEVDERYQHCVNTLTSIHTFLSSRTPQPAALGCVPVDLPSGREVLSHVDKLRLTAVSKVRSYFIAQIQGLRARQTNVCVLQNNRLLKYKGMMKFLGQAAPDVREEIREVYVEAMSKTLCNLFRTYQGQLGKMCGKVAGKGDLIGGGEGGVFGGNKTVSKKLDPFTIGDRGRVLAMSDCPPILVHVAMSEKETYPYEMLFRSIQKHLMDACTGEYVFTKSFFEGNCRETFNGIVTKTLSCVLEGLENYLFGCWDAVGLLCMIRLTHQNRQTMKSRRCNVLDNLFDRINMLLWPRLKTVIDNNVKSVKGVVAKKMGTGEVHAHPISRRYAEFGASILTLLKGMENAPGAEATTNGAVMLKGDMEGLRGAVVQTLGRLSDQHANSMTRTVFLINNYDQIITVFGERKVEREEVNKFNDKLKQQRAVFVEEKLSASYGKLITFVKQTESSQAAGAQLDLDQNLVEGLVRQFATTWKSGIESINRDVLSMFSNFRNGTEILKQTLTQLLLYYTRFQEIIRKAWRRPPGFVRDIVSTNAILTEIKKFAMAI